MAHEFGKNMGAEEREERWRNGFAIQAFSTFNAELKIKEKSKEG